MRISEANGDASLVTSLGKQTEGVTDLLFNDLQESLHNLARAASKDLLLVAPFIKHAQLRAVLECVRGGVRTVVVTRWRPDEVAAGVSDLEVFDVCQDAGTELRLLDRLHAKLFVSDGREALLGSANLTARGLGAVDPANLELLLPCCPSARSLVIFTTKLRTESRLASEAERDIVAELARGIKPDEREVAVPISMDMPIWLPEFRSPDRIFEVYRSLGEGFPSAAEAGAIRDLSTLDVPFDLARADFEAVVRDRLRRQACVIQLDAFLNVPRRFGEVSEWVGRLRPGATHRERQHASQSLLRWLTYFDRGRYFMETPRYSEIVSLVAAPETLEGKEIA